MIEGKRQRQVAGVLQEALNDIFRHLSLNMMQGGMVSISSVKVTPDLPGARIYISLFQVAGPEKAMKSIESRAWEITKELSQRVKHQLRRIPALHFYRDDTLDYVFKMEEIFKNIAAPEKENEDNTPS